MAYTTFISHSSGGLKSKIKDQLIHYLVRAHFLVADDQLLAVSSHGQGLERALCGLIHESSTLKT